MRTCACTGSRELPQQGSSVGTVHTDTGYHRTWQPVPEVIPPFFVSAPRQCLDRIVLGPY